MPEEFKEADMFQPVKDFFEEQGYTVNSEVISCDFTACKEEELIIGEIKKSFNMKLLYQLIDRQKISDAVFAVIPRPKGKKAKEFEKTKYILKTLNMGLITVAMDSPTKYVELIMLPKDIKSRQNQKRRERLLKELRGRSEDMNTGGSNKVKIMTAFRERNIKALCVLEKEGEMSPAKFRHLYGFEKEISSLLRMNTYQWFDKKERGIYILSEEGKKELENPLFPAVVAYYRKEIK